MSGMTEFEIFTSTLRYAQRYRTSGFRFYPASPRPMIFNTPVSNGFLRFTNIPIPPYFHTSIQISPLYKLCLIGVAFTLKSCYLLASPVRRLPPVHPAGPDGSASDVRGIGGWIGGKQVVEMSRVLQNKQSDDITFDRGRRHAYIVNLLRGKDLIKSSGAAVLTIRWLIPVPNRES